MKNKLKILIVSSIILIIFQKISFSKEILINSQEINIYDNGNVIVAINGTASSAEDFIRIFADRIEYKKKENIISSFNSLAILDNKNTEIRSNKIVFNKKESLLEAYGSVKLENKEKNIFIESDEIIYDLKKQLILSKSKSKIKFFNDNLLKSDFISYNLLSEILKLENLILIDEIGNETNLENAYLNLKTKNLLGKDVVINLNNQNFNKENNPRLKGKSIIKDDNLTVINKSVFTTCKIRKDKCPPWHFTAEKIIHNKDKKIMQYENFWLNIYDKPIIYFPKFFHPDPSVKRQSGFLIPKFQSSTAQGTSFNLPYFKVISDNKDLTITPRIYAEKKLLIQNEYRQANKDSDFISDFSILKDDNKDSNTHIFANLKKNLFNSTFDETNLDIQVQSVNNDTYLKKYKLDSPLINNETTLQSGIKLNAQKEDLKFEVDFRVYEDLNKADTDRYEYIYPNYRLTKKFNISDHLPGELNFITSGYSKTTKTNVHEKMMINDLVLELKEKISKNGVLNNSSFFLKNINTDAKNSSSLKEEFDTQAYTLLKNDTSFPLLKETDDFSHLLNPKLTFMFSPTNSKNYRNDDKRLSIQNIYNQNRIGSDTSFESGTSFTYGLDYEINDNQGNEIFTSKIANVFRLEKDEKLPKNNNLGDKTSDLIGILRYRPSDKFNLNYEYSYDNNFTDSTYQLVSSEFRINNFVTSFEYLNENNTKKSYLSNKSTYTFDRNNSLSYGARTNKESGDKEFYNLIYQYKNDCLVAGLEYKKNYYSDKDLKPEESIFFKLTIVPFGGTNSPDLID